MRNWVVPCLLVLLCGCAGEDAGPSASECAADAARALKSGRYAKAKELALEAHRRKPQVAEYCVAIAFAAARMKEPDIAAEYYTKALAILREQARSDPERVDDHAMVLFCLGREAEAREVLGVGVKRFPEAEMLRKLQGCTDDWFAGFSEYTVEGARQPSTGTSK